MTGHEARLLYGVHLLQLNPSRADAVTVEKSDVTTTEMMAVRSLCCSRWDQTLQRLML